MRRLAPARLSVLMAGVVCLGGCAQGTRLTRPPPPEALAGDRYAIAHGMALSFMTSGRATGMDLLQVIHLDRAAVLALAQGSTSPAPADALIDYVTRREIDASPAPSTVPSEFLRKPQPVAVPAPRS